MQREQIQRALVGCEFFDGFDKTVIEKVSLLCWERSFSIGEYVFHQGDFGEHLYIVAEGQVCLERSVNLGSRKGSIPIESLGKGRVLGSWSTLLDQRHVLMSSAVCEKPTQLLVIRGADLRYLMLSDKNLGFALLEKFCFLLKDRIQAAYGAMEKI